MSLSSSRSTICNSSQKCCHLPENQHNGPIDRTLNYRQADIDCRTVNRCFVAYSCNGKDCPGGPVAKLPSSLPTPSSIALLSSSTLSTVGQSFQMKSAEKMKAVDCSSPFSTIDSSLNTGSNGSSLDLLSIRRCNRLRAQALKHTFGAPTPKSKAPDLPLDSPLCKMSDSDLCSGSSRHRAYRVAHSSSSLDSSRSSLLFRSDALPCASSKEASSHNHQQSNTSITSSDRTLRPKGSARLIVATKVANTFGRSININTTLHRHFYFFYSLFIVYILFSSIGFKGMFFFLFYYSLL